MPVVPYWALMQRPACLRALGLELPVTAEDVLAAYREQAKTMHPDRGGDLQEFLRLQKHFEQAMHIAQRQQVQ
jgi:DnaJ-class molecular chaperone